jgi:hypothetical protein
MGPLRLEKCQVVAFRGNLPQIVLLVAVFAFWPNAGYADPINWNISISNPNQSGPPGSTLVFDGVITNNTGGDLIFDTVKIPFATSVSPSSFVKDFSDGFLSTLGIIPASGYSGPLFFIQWLNSAPMGAVGTGSFVLTAESPANPLSEAPSFAVAVSTVSSTPELPSSHFVALSLALLALSRVFLPRRVGHGGDRVDV